MVSVAHMSASGSSWASTFTRVWTMCHWYPGMPQGRGSIGWRGSVYPGTLPAGEPHVTCQETHSNSTDPRTTLPRIWRLLSDAVETPRPGPEKLGAVRTDRDLIGLLLTLI